MFCRSAHSDYSVFDVDSFAYKSKIIVLIGDIIEIIVLNYSLQKGGVPHA